MILKPTVYRIDIQSRDGFWHEGHGYYHDQAEAEADARWLRTDYWRSTRVVSVELLSFERVTEVARFDPPTETEVIA